MEAKTLATQPTRVIPTPARADAQLPRVASADAQPTEQQLWEREFPTATPTEDQSISTHAASAVATDDELLDPATCLEVIAVHIVDFLVAYSEAAQLCYNRGLTRFKLNPKGHAFMHIIDRICQGGERQSWTWNPLGDASQMDEDFIGKIAALSCASSTKTMHLQTISRYLTNLWRYLKKFA